MATLSFVKRREAQRGPGPGPGSVPGAETTTRPRDVQKVTFGEKERQEWSSSLDQEDPGSPHIREDQQDPDPKHIKEDPDPPQIKEEQEELWTNQEGDQLERLDEAEVPKSRFTRVPVKSEEDEEKPQPSQLHHSQTEEDRGVEPRHMKTEADGDDGGGGAEPARTLDPEKPLNPDADDKMSDSSEPETDDSDEWINPSSTQSDLNSARSPGDPSGGQRRGTGGKSNTCSDCGKTFCSRSSLSLHQRAHAGEKPFACPVCRKSFHARKQLNRHAKHHAAEKPFGCPVCRKGFVCSGTLSIHMRIHGEEKPFACPVCHRGFTQRHTLVRHARTHTGEKPLSCSACDQRFAWRYQLENHRCAGGTSGRHQSGTEGNGGAEPLSRSPTGDGGGGTELADHSDPDATNESREPLRSDQVPKGDGAHRDGEKRFICTECGKSFVNNSNRQRHIRSHAGHKPLSCSDCGRGFRQRSDLLAHFRTHTGERPFPCSICGARFARHDTLVQHGRTHSGEKPFSCAACSRSFSHKSNLKKHALTHSGEKRPRAGSATGGLGLT